jgi:K+-sensing histidine kinase KdpD
MSHVTKDIRLSNLEIYADPLFETVLFSLAENSLTHGRTVTEIRMSCRKAGDDLIVSFEDNGQGIPPEKKEDVFLQQLSSGSGISLFLAREILSITGITLHETGTFMQGAYFEMRIPRGGYRFSEGGSPDTI